MTTEINSDPQSCYLAGPMRGIEEYNFPAFRAETKWLREAGWFVFSPAERDEQDPEIDHTENIAGWSGTRGLDYFMAHDLKAVCEMDAVVCLPNWEDSQGARLETIVAVEIDHPVFEIVDTGGYKRLERVHPSYIRWAFSTRGGRENTAAVWPDETEPVEEVEEIEYAQSALPSDSDARKAVPIATGVLDYFPAALAEVAKVSKAGNDKHNPGQPLHHARGKSTDHADALLRHLVDRGKVDAETGQRHSAEVAWRALANLQQELEDAGLAPLPRGAK